MALHFISEQPAYSFITASPHLCPLPYRQHSQHGLCICVCVFFLFFFLFCFVFLFVCFFWKHAGVSVLFCMYKCAHTVKPASQAGQQGNAGNSAQFLLVTLFCAKLLWEVSGVLYQQWMSRTPLQHWRTGALLVTMETKSHHVFFPICVQHNPTNSKASLIKFRQKQKRPRLNNKICNCVTNAVPDWPQAIMGLPVSLYWPHFLFENIPKIWNQKDVRKVDWSNAKMISAHYNFRPPSITKHHWKFQL